MTMTSKTQMARRIFMVLSPRTLDYARGALKSLLTNALEPIHLHLITDTYADKQLFIRICVGNQVQMDRFQSIGQQALQGASRVVEGARRENHEDSACHLGFGRHCHLPEALRISKWGA